MDAASQPSSALLVALTDPAALDSATVGAKASSLAECLAAGFTVPEGTVLTAEAFRRAGGEEADATPDALRSAPMPGGVEEALLAAGLTLAGAPLAVRSSSVAEDLAGASFAGQYATILGVRDPAQLVDAVRACWASALAPHAREYRSSHALDAASMAVLIQRQIVPRAAGIAFSANPVTGDPTVAVVNAVAGLADRLAGGTETPEVWQLAEDGAIDAPDAPTVLAPDDAAAVARLARDVASWRGMPQDIEWAIDDVGLWLLQTRPITALPSAPIRPVPVPIEPPEGYWERDASHWPAPHSPLGRSIIYPMTKTVSPLLFRYYGMLVDGLEFTDIGGWHYFRNVPFGGRDRRPPPALVLGLMARLHPAMRSRVQRARQVVRDGIAAQVVSRWFDEWQPSLEGRQQALLRTDLASLADSALAAHVEAAIELCRDGLTSHMHVIGALVVETDPLVQLTRNTLGWGMLQSLELVSGLSFRSSEPGRELARLADRARGKPALLDALGDVTPATYARIAEIDPDLGADLETYRWYYGARLLSRDPADPTLADRPELLVRMLAGQIVAKYDPEAIERRNAERRAEMLAQVRAAFRDRGGDEPAAFEQALARAERAYPLREDNVFVALQAPYGLVRYAALEFGRRMAERGQLDQADEVFFLEYPELRKVFESGADVRDLVERRKGERAWALAHPGPASYGTPPGPPPSFRYLPAEARALTEAFMGFFTDDVNQGSGGEATAGSISGVAGSPGRYTGPVRVVMDDSEFAKIQAGDVVVCPVTQPTWSVVFPLLGAVVTDTGGVLSHPAIIAREYRIPAVVATGNGTRQLRDGQVVSVDGDAGTVVPVS